MMRIMNDIVDFNQNKPDGMYLYVDKKNIKNQYALIIGLEGTPYFGGFFFFEIKYPDDYPKNSPSVNLLTIDSKVRFNPNLYENGKVCLSILGTWQGPSWTPVMNIRLVLDSIRSLMSEFPIRNEPGFENYKPDCNASIEYNQYLIFNTYKVAILDVLDNRFENISSLFTKEIENEMIKNKTRLLNDLLSYESIYGKKEVDAKIYFMKKTKLDFPDILEKFKKKIVNKF
jgi:ubiquitin-conjugating enzyme E2 Z